MSDKGYSFRPSIELMRELKDLTAKDKIQWLDETNEFISKFLSAADIERWKKVISAHDKTN